MKKNLSVIVLLLILSIVIAGLLFYRGEQRNDLKDGIETDAHQHSTHKQESSVDDKFINNAEQLPNSANLTVTSKADMFNIMEKSEQDSQVNNLKHSQDMNDPLITDSQAIAIARKAIGPIRFHEGGDITVERADGLIRVRFPVNKTTAPGTRYRGPSYAAEVEMDAKSGEVLRNRLGG
jgi:uncharacterized membrane protein YkoI